MKQYFNIYVMLNKLNDMRMFKKCLGTLDTENNYSSDYQNYIQQFIEYREQNEGKELIYKLEDTIPKEGTVFNFVPRTDYIDDDDVE